MQNSKNKTVVGGQTLIQGNSLKILSEYKKKSLFDACITDPPYNISNYDNKKKIGWLQSNKIWKEEKKFNKINEKWDSFSSDEAYSNFTEKWIKLVCKLVKPNGNIVIFGTYHNIFLIGHILKKLDNRIINSIVWYKRNAFPNITQRMLCESTEYMIWAVNNSQKKAKNWTFNYKVLKEMNHGKQMRNVWDIPNSWSKEEKKFGKHPSQKPLVLMKRLILGLTKEGDNVLDPFLGSGSTTIACAETNRKSTGIELDRDYFKLAKKRLEFVVEERKNNPKIL